MRLCLVLCSRLIPSLSALLLDCILLRTVPCPSMLLCLVFFPFSQLPCCSFLLDQPNAQYFKNVRQLGPFPKLTYITEELRIRVSVHSSIQCLLNARSFLLSGFVPTSD